MLDASVVFPCPLAVALRRMHDLFFHKQCTNSCPVWPLKKSYKCVESDMLFISSFAFLSFCAEHGAGHCFLPQSPWNEPPGVPYVILLIVVFVIPLPEPCVGFTAHSRPCHSETALPRRQTPQGHQWTGGDGEDLRQSQYNFYRTNPYLTHPYLYQFDGRVIIIVKGMQNIDILFMSCGLCSYLVSFDFFLFNLKGPL